MRARGLGVRFLLAGAGLLAAGCSDPTGIVRIHFGLRPPRVIEFGEDAGPPPVDPYDLRRASGTVEVFVDIQHLTSELSGLPALSDPERVYRFWLSDSDRGGGWVLASELEPTPAGAAAVHLNPPDVAIDLPTVRAAIVSIEARAETDEPSRLVVLTGAVGQDPEPSTTGAGNGAPVHQH